jgi:hypothetical protein
MTRERSSLEPRRVRAEREPFLAKIWTENCRSLAYDSFAVQSLTFRHRPATATRLPNRFAHCVRSSLARVAHFVRSRAPPLPMANRI